jgi:RES domain-containing protein
VSGYDTVQRAGRYLRVIAPDWVDPLDTAYSKRTGGRWNVPGVFGALYLCADVHVAAANARARHAGRALKLFDLRPEARPQLVTVGVPPSDVVDAWTTSGVGALGFAESFPYEVPWVPCQAIAHAAYVAGVAGVAARSNAEATPTRYVGEELAVFEGTDVRDLLERQQFAQWYPDPIPE